jgi:SP family general alpha glucoside:H+ symporter-like MFS transporter
MGLPAFRRKFGHYVNPEVGYQVSAPWQTGLTMAPVVGAFLGVLCTGTLADRWGYKRTAIGAQLLMLAVIFATVFAPNLAVLLVGEFLCGLPWGAFVVVAPSYSSEIAPLALRGILTMYIQLCWCIGQFIASGVLYSVRNRPDVWAYKIPFAVQWAWPVPIIAVLAFAPESPWWLARHGRRDEAEVVLRRLATTRTVDPRDTLAAMVRTIEIEAAATRGASYADCLRGTDLRRTLIASGIHAAANVTGLLLSNLGTYFFTITGMGTDQAFALGLGTTGIQFAAVFGSWWLSTLAGRRTMYLYGLGFNIVVCALIGVLACIRQSTSVLLAQGVLVILLAFQWGFTLGPVTWAYQGEISSVRLRSQTVALSRDTYYVSTVIFSIINSYMLNPTGWGLIGKSGFVWCGTCSLLFVASYFCLPEVAGKTFREIDVLFHRKVPARQFGKTVVEADEDH